MFGGKKLSPTKLSYYEFQIDFHEKKITEILGNKFMNEEQKEKLRTKYNKIIQDFKAKLEKEKMNSK